MFDPRCFDLAEYFLPTAPAQAKAKLAQWIQDAIESWLEDEGAKLEAEEELND
jgi:hypothetical protein